MGQEYTSVSVRISTRDTSPGVNPYPIYCYFRALGYARMALRAYPIARSGFDGMETFKAPNPRTWRTPRRRQALGGLRSLATLREGAIHHGVKGLAIARYRKIGGFVMQMVRLDKLACRVFVLHGHQLQGKIFVRLGLQPFRTVH